MCRKGTDREVLAPGRSREPANARCRRNSLCKTGLLDTSDGDESPGGHAATARLRSRRAVIVRGHIVAHHVTSSLTGHPVEGCSSGVFELNQYQSQRTFERDLSAATTERPVLFQEGHTTSPLVRSFCGAHILLLLAPFAGHAQAPNMRDRRESRITRAERKGKDLDVSGTVPFSQIVLPLVSVLKHFLDMQKSLLRSLGSQRASLILFASLTHPWCSWLVGQRRLASKCHGGCVWCVRKIKEKKRKTKDSGAIYVIDCMHRAYLRSFVNQDLLPFSNSSFRRCRSRRSLVRR